MRCVRRRKRIKRCALALPPPHVTPTSTLNATRPFFSSSSSPSRPPLPSHLFSSPPPPPPIMSDPGCRLFVGNLSWNTTDESMRMAFEDGAGVPGSVLDSKVILDRETGRSRYVSLVSSLLVRAFLIVVLVPCATVLCEVHVEFLN